MKRSIACFGLLLLAPVFAGPDISRSVLRMNELDEARTEAAEKGEPLVIVCSSETTTCPLSNNACEASLKAFRSVGVVVFADVNNDRSSLPAGAMELYRSPERGKTYPFVFVTSSDGEKPIKVVPYTELKADARKAARETKKVLTEDLVAGSPVSEPAEAESTTAETSGPLAEETDWTDSLGRTMRAAVIGVDATSVMFKLPDGKLVEYPLLKLSEESRKTIEGLR